MTYNISQNMVMSRKVLFFALFLQCLVLGYGQHDYNAMATLLEQKGNKAVFSVEVDADKKKNLEPNAAEALMYLLLTRGVEGFENGKPLMEKENPYWMKNIFFNGKSPVYKGFVTATEMVSTPQSVGGVVRATVKVSVNAQALLRALKGYGVMGAADSKAVSEDSKQPTNAASEQPVQPQGRTYDPLAHKNKASVPQATSNHASASTTRQASSTNNIQNVLGQFYNVSVHDSRYTGDIGNVKVRYRLDSIVGDARTGYLTIYQSIGGISTNWYNVDLLGHYVNYGIKTLGSGEIDRTSLYAQFPRDGYRNMVLREIVKCNRGDKHVEKIEIGFLDDIISLSYKNVPIIWRTHTTPPACRPAEYYLTMKHNENMVGGTAVVPYGGGMEKNRWSRYGELGHCNGDSYCREVVLNRTINLELKGVVGNASTGEICPIFALMTTHDENWLVEISSVDLYDEEGNYSHIGEKYYTEKSYFLPDGFWTEVADLTTTVAPGSATLQKMTVLVSMKYDGDGPARIFEFRDVPIQWIDVK